MSRRRPTRIGVPDIPGPTRALCYAQKLDRLGVPGEITVMARCDRAKGHPGPHLWALMDALIAAQGGRR